MGSLIPSRSLASIINAPIIQPLFAGTLFLSAMLLFSVQPMYAKQILPKLGGAPSVWAVAMCFFQATLLAGYGYTYALTRWTSHRASVAFHLLLLLTTSFMLPFGIPMGFAEPVQDGADIWLLELLFVGIGLPFFVVSATAPLLQRWFSLTDSESASDPYFLYAFSNLGSMVALLLYPIVLEPKIGLNAQSRLWFGGFILFTIMVALCGTFSLFRSAERKSFHIGAAIRSESIRWLDRFIWVALAFVPSGLVIAVTTYISTDVASAPFLWVVPLALFLMTFVLVFQEQLPFRYDQACTMLPVAILGMVAMSVILASTPFMLVPSVFAIVSFFLAAIICHRELYLRRPRTERLAEFYLWMSFGGVLGGIFAALVAPHVFTTTFEFPLLILLSLLCRPGLLLARAQPLRWPRIGLIAFASFLVIGGYMLGTAIGFISQSRIYLILLISVVCGGLLLIRKWPEHDPALVLVMIVAAALAPADHQLIYAERSFFGNHKVMLTEDGAYRFLLHGTTVHGAQRLIDSAGQETPLVPATYYHATGPMARGIAIARASLSEARRPFNVGVVGLGTGSLSCYAQDREHWRYFEIDPAVIRIATDPQYFSFLNRCMSNPDIVVGDARLTVAREAKDFFGYLVIDAFSSDSIPVHLLTTEALQLFIDKLDPNGILALHISNRHLDLASPLASTIARLPGTFAVLVDDLRPANDLATSPSQVVFVARKKSVLTSIASWPDARELPMNGVRPWSDDYSDVFGALIRRATHR